MEAQILEELKQINQNLSKLIAVMANKEALQISKEKNSSIKDQIEKARAEAMAKFDKNNLK